MQHDHRFIWLDVVRSASALTVCAGHLRSAIIADYTGVYAHSIFHKLFYIITGLAHQSVIVFFVLSGFFVGGSVLKSRERFRLVDYGIARLARLWIVLIPALAVTLIIDKVIAAYEPEVLQGAYYNLWNSGPAVDLYSASAFTLLANVCFLQTILTPDFGTNSPLWSLSYEFWYYVLFPLCAYALGQCGNPRHISSRSVAGIIAVLIFFCLPAGIRHGYLIWLMGVVAYLTCSGLALKQRTFALVSALVLFAGSLAYSKSISRHGPLGVTSDYAVGIGCAALCLVIATWPAPGSTRLGMIIRTLATTVADFSYSLYLSHFPFIMLIAVFVYGCTKKVPDVKGLLCFCGWYSILLCIGVLFWFMFERHTAALRRVVTSRLGMLTENGSRRPRKL